MRERMNPWLMTGFKVLRCYTILHMNTGYNPSQPAARGMPMITSMICDSNGTKRLCSLALWLSIGLQPLVPNAAQALPAVSAPLSANASEPAELGWMQGFPPAPDKLIRAADGSFFQFPALRYSVTNMRQFMPTVEVSRGLGAPVPLEYRLDPLIDHLQFLPWGSAQPVSFEDALWLNYTDGLIILHRGQVVYERYLGALAEDKKHAAMSVTKSFTGTLAPFWWPRVFWMKAEWWRNTCPS